MKRTAIALVLALFCLPGFSQVKELNPAKTSKMPEINLAGIPAQLEQIDKMRENNQKLTKQQEALYQMLDEDPVLEHFYSGACSWYCGGIIDTVKASSCLKQQGKFSYDGWNAHDWSILSAWVEGVKGNGVGESLTYFFPGNCPRITAVQILNGYVKTQKAWQENSRVKKLKVYYMEKPYAILNLKDTRDLQIFELGEPLGPHDVNAPQWTLKFEILEVYPGTKYEDTAITEIFFDGIDVH